MKQTFTHSTIKHVLVIMKTEVLTVSMNVLLIVLSFSLIVRGRVRVRVRDG